MEEGNFVTDGELMADLRELVADSRSEWQHYADYVVRQSEQRSLGMFAALWLCLGIIVVVALVRRGE